MGAIEEKFNCCRGNLEYITDADHLWFQTEELTEYENVMYWVSYSLVLLL